MPACTRDTIASGGDEVGAFYRSRIGARSVGDLRVGRTHLGSEPFVTEWCRRHGCVPGVRVLAGGRRLPENCGAEHSLKAGRSPLEPRHGHWRPGLTTPCWRSCMCSAPLSSRVTSTARAREQGNDAGQSYRQHGRDGRPTRPHPNKGCVLWTEDASPNAMTTSVSAGQHLYGAPRRNRTGDPILTMEPPGTAVRNTVSPGHARPSGPKLSALSTRSYAFSYVSGALSTWLNQGPFAQLNLSVDCRAARSCRSILPLAVEAHWASVSRISRTQCYDAKRPPLRGVGAGACGEWRG
jgi:hypothetical protein